MNRCANHHGIKTRCTERIPVVAENASGGTMGSSPGVFGRDIADGKQAGMRIPVDRLGPQLADRTSSSNIAMVWAVYWTSLSTPAVTMCTRGGVVVSWCVRVV